MSIPIRSEVNTVGISDPANASFLSHAYDETARTVQQIQTAGIRDSDSVVVIGRKTLPQLIALNRLNCRSVTAINPDRRLPAIHKADVIWVTGDVAADFSLLPLVDNAEWLRVIIFEQADFRPGSLLPLLLKDLRFRGFIHVACHRMDGSKSITLSRPAWLRRIV